MSLQYDTAQCNLGKAAARNVTGWQWMA